MKCHRDLGSSKRLRDRSKRNPRECLGREILLKDSYPEGVFLSKRERYNLDRNQWCRTKNVSKLITAAKNNLQFHFQFYSLLSDTPTTYFLNNSLSYKELTNNLFFFFFFYAAQMHFCITRFRVRSANHVFLKGLQHSATSDRLTPPSDIPQILLFLIIATNF